MRQEAMGLESAMRKSDGVTVDHEKNSDWVRVRHKNERWGES